MLFTLEVGKSNQAQVPKEYEHLQSLKGKVRFIRADLRARYDEQQVAGESAREREQELLRGLTDQLVKHADSLKLLSRMIARVDVYVSLAAVAATHGYVRPQVGTSELVIEGGQHQVVERHARFMHNDLELRPDMSLIVLTGPNMSCTSIYDGLAIATAATEYLHDHLRAFSLFATHYAEFTELAERLEQAENRHVAAEEQGGELVFYHQVLPGPASRSYGIEVAQLAGMPTPVVERAKTVLSELQQAKRSS